MILRLLGSLTKTQNSTDNQQNSSSQSLGNELKNASKDIATEFLTEQAASLVGKYGAMLRSLSPKQKDYVIRIAYLKSVNPSELNLDEILELGEAINKAASLGVEINNELNQFWNEVFSIVKQAGEKFVDIGTRALSSTLLGILI